MLSQKISNAEKSYDGQGRGTIGTLQVLISPKKYEMVGDKRAVDYMRSKIEDPYLFIFSDDMEWVKEHMEFDLDYLLIRGYGFSLRYF